MITFQEGCVFFFLFVVCWLLHELFHIKGQGLINTGKIFVERFGFTCVSDRTIDSVWLSLSGGILTSLVSFIMLLLSIGTSYVFGFLTVGWTQLIYGLYEGFCKVNVRSVRYVIYVCVFVFWFVVWWVV